MNMNMMYGYRLEHMGCRVPGTGGARLVGELIFLEVLPYVMPSQAVGERLYDAGALATPRRLHAVRHRLTHAQHVGTIHAEPLPFTRIFLFPALGFYFYFVFIFRL